MWRLKVDRTDRTSVKEEGALHLKQQRSLPRFADPKTKTSNITSSSLWSGPVLTVWRRGMGMLGSPDTAWVYYRSITTALVHLIFSQGLPPFSELLFLWCVAATLLTHLLLIWTDVKLKKKKKKKKSGRHLRDPQPVFFSRPAGQNHDSR